MTASGVKGAAFFSFLLLRFTLPLTSAATFPLEECSKLGSSLNLVVISVTKALTTASSVLVN